MSKKTIDETKQWLKNQLALSSDVESSEMKYANNEAYIFYVKSVCNADTISRYIVTPFFKAAEATDYEKYLLSFPGTSQPKDQQDILEKVLDGFVAVFMKTGILLFEARKIEASPVAQANVEVSILGPQDALNENLSTNLNLIRHRYHSGSLTIEQQTVGQMSQTKVAVVYDQSIADQTILSEVKNKLSGIKVDVLQSVGQLHQLLSKQKWSLFPTYLITERPDRIVKNLAQGKVVIVFATSPFALIIPSVFFDFFSSMDDIYQLPGVGRFLSFLRYIGLFIATLLPGLYVGIVAYNPEVFRVQLALSIAGSRAAVPYPSYLEVLFMLMMMEFLIEASIRLPKTVGPTATTVGGLILGQAATEAGLVSNIMIIIVASVAISNFVIPINAMGFAIRVVKYPILLLAGFFGLVGVVVGLVGLVFYLSNLRSFGMPYLKLFETDQFKNKDQNKRPQPEQ